MFKAAGLLLIVAVCGIFGLRASSSLKLRKHKLSEFCLLIGETEDMMRLGAELRQIYKTERAKKLLNVTGYTAMPKEDGLLAEDRDILAEFFSKLGMGDLKSSLDLCDAYGQIISKKAAEAEKEMKEKSRLYSMLGLFSGLFIAILLI